MNDEAASPVDSAELLESLSVRFMVLSIHVAACTQDGGAQLPYCWAGREREQGAW